VIDVTANVAALRSRIDRAARRVGRDPAGVLLVAAAKTMSAAMVDEAIAAGVADIGENYVQEAAVKKAQVARPARWHMIGHLQRNKAARAVEVFDVVQTIDSVALGAALAQRSTAAHRRLGALIEVNLGAEAAKSGVAADQLPELLAELRERPGLSVDGLMTVPPIGSAEETRPFFRRLRELRDRLGLNQLSMGMTNDFEVAIEEGATMVRIGRAIFGERR
jgi:hypothetical protein